MLSASAGGRYCRKGRAKVVRYCALHKLIHKGYHVRIAFSRAENYGYNAAYVLAEGDGIAAVYGTGAYGGALAAYALGIGVLRYGGIIKAVYYNPLRL